MVEEGEEEGVEAGWMGIYGLGGPKMAKTRRHPLFFVSGEVRGSQEASIYKDSGGKERRTVGATVRWKEPLGAEPRLADFWPRWVRGRGKIGMGGAHDMPVSACLAFACSA